MRCAALALVLCAGCGRIGFDGADGYFLSPTGNDDNPGTRAAPWLTFAAALPRLAAGDHLTLLDAVYDAKGPSGAFELDCDHASNGTAAQPIVVNADHPRAAHLISGDKVVLLDHCTGWEIDDLWLEGRDQMVGHEAQVAEVSNSTDIALRRLLVVHPNRYDNDHAVEIARSQRVLAEDLEIYDFFRDAMSIFLSRDITVRRLYANGRGAADVAGGYPSSCPGGDGGVASYYSSGGIVEDSIIENICSTGFGQSAGRDQPPGDTGLGDRLTWSADIALGPGDTGFEIFTDCDDVVPCDTPDRVCSDNAISHVVSIGFMNGFQIEGIATTLDHITAIATDADVFIHKASAAGIYDASASLVAGLGLGAPNGVVVADQTDWSVAMTNIFGATLAFQPDDAHVMTSTTVDPQLGGCLVYLPPTSPMIGAGPNGTAIGADLRTQTLDGAATSTPYWTPSGPFAGCGAVVPGVNDDPSTSCIGVHQRLHVGSGGCAVPSL